MSLVCFHGCLLAGHELFFPVKGHAIVSVFFVLSGMLTYQGFVRNSDTWSFYRRRFRKIYPAYAAVVLLCALVLPLVLCASPGECFVYAGFWKYIAANLSFLNFLAPEIPGVFGANMIHAVNSSLWTMKVEVMFYAVFPIVFWLTRRFRPVGVLVLVYVLSVAYNLYFTSAYMESGLEKFDVIRRQLPGQMMYFVAGMLSAEYRGLLMRRKCVALPAGIAAWLLCAACPQLRPVEPLAIAVTLTVAAYASTRMSSFSARVPNLTYEVYLLHFPTMQALVSLGVLSGVGFVPFFAISVLVVVLLSFLLHKAVRLVSR